MLHLYINLFLLIMIVSVVCYAVVIITTNSLSLLTIYCCRSVDMVGRCRADIPIAKYNSTTCCTITQTHCTNASHRHATVSHKRLQEQLHNMPYNHTNVCTKHCTTRYSISQRLAWSHNQLYSCMINCGNA